MTIERTFDYELVERLMKEPRVYRHCCDDFSPPVDQFHVLRNDHVWYLLASDEAGVVGVFMLIPQTTVCWEVHHFLQPEAWGARARAAAIAGLHWVFRHTTCRRVVGSTPVYNRLACKFALDIGMRPMGTNKKSFMRHGKLHDQLLTGCSLEDLWQE